MKISPEFLEEKVMFRKKSKTRNMIRIFAKKWTLVHVAIVVVQLLNCVQLFVTPWTVVCQASLSFIISQSLVNSCPLSQWGHTTISSFAATFSPSFNLSQHQGLFQWVDSSHQESKVLELQLQSFQWIFRVGFLSLKQFQILQKIK